MLRVVVQLYFWRDQVGDETVSRLICWFFTLTTLFLKKIICKGGASDHQQRWHDHVDDIYLFVLQYCQGKEKEQTRVRRKTKKQILFLAYFYFLIYLFFSPSLLEQPRLRHNRSNTSSIAQHPRNGHWGLFFKIQQAHLQPWFYSYYLIFLHLFKTKTKKGRVSRGYLLHLCHREGVVIFHQRDFKIFKKILLIPSFSNLPPLFF